MDFIHSVLSLSFVPPAQTQEEAKMKAAEVARKKADFEQAQADLQPLQATLST